MPDKRKCLVVTGPTASGKSSLVMRIAEELNGEIVCMDSMQIYRGMDIGTAKPTPEDRRRVPHHMLDIADPDEAFSVAMWCERAEAEIRSILSRQRLPVIVGGTGLYLRALRHPMALGYSVSSPDIRGEMERLAETEEGKRTLHRRLAERDPRAAEKLHVNNVRRVIRALEVMEMTGKRFSEQAADSHPSPFDFVCFCLSMDRQVLYGRIDRRVHQMVEQGLVQEVKNLMASGVPGDAQSMQGIGYKEIIRHLKGEMSLDDSIREIQQNTRHYAKRQMTWFRREEEMHWLDAGSPDLAEQVLTQLKNGESL